MLCYRWVTWIGLLYRCSMLRHRSHGLGCYTNTLCPQVVSLFDEEDSGCKMCENDRWWCWTNERLDLWHLSSDSSIWYCVDPVVWRWKNLWKMNAVAVPESCIWRWPASVLETIGSKNHWLYQSSSSGHNFLGWDLTRYRECRLPNDRMARMTTARIPRMHVFQAQSEMVCFGHPPFISARKYMFWGWHYTVCLVSVE
jgi:hypothetical protein